MQRVFLLLLLLRAAIAKRFEKVFYSFSSVVVVLKNRFKVFSHQGPISEKLRTFCSTRFCASDRDSSSSGVLNGVSELGVDQPLVWELIQSVGNPGKGNHSCQIIRQIPTKAKLATWTSTLGEFLPSTKVSLNFLTFFDVFSGKSRSYNFTFLRGLKITKILARKRS